MQKAIDQVMYAYTLINHLTPDEVEGTRARLAAHLAELDCDETKLAVEGMRYLRGPNRQVSKRRMARKTGPIA